LAESGSPVVGVVRHECADEECGAIWMVLPVFVARHLWRSWQMVTASTVREPPPAQRPSVPLRTRQRWWTRLLSAAVVVVQVLATSSEERLEAVAKVAGLDARRVDLVGVYVAQMATERPLEEIAALVHRLERGVRLM
jgi:hypothetical protein